MSLCHWIKGGLQGGKCSIWKKKNLPKDHLNRTIQQAVREMYLKIFVLDI